MLSKQSQYKKYLLSAHLGAASIVAVRRKPVRLVHGRYQPGFSTPSCTRPMRHKAFGMWPVRRPGAAA